MLKLFTIFTFPGIIFHEISHRFLCDITHSQITEINYYTLNNDDTLGFLGLPQPSSIYKSIFISLAPFFLNNLLSTILLTPTYICFISETKQILDFSNYFLLWIGFSLIYESIPSKDDIVFIEEHIKSIKIPLYSFTLLPMMKLLKLISILDSIILLRLIYVLFIYYLNLELTSILCDKLNL